MSEPDAVRAEAPSWGGASLVFCIVGGIVAIGGGLNLVGLKAAGENSMIEAIAHGIGWYCIGKGLFMIASPFQLRGAVVTLFGK